MRFNGDVKEGMNFSVGLRKAIQTTTNDAAMLSRQQHNLVNPWENPDSTSSLQRLHRALGKEVTQNPIQTSIQTLETCRVQRQTFQITNHADG